MKNLLLSIVLFNSHVVFSQAGFANPVSFDFQYDFDEINAANFSFNEFFVGRNFKDSEFQNFKFLKNSLNNRTYLKLRKNIKLHTQIQRTDEFFLADRGVTDRISQSFIRGFQWNPDTNINLSGSKIGLIGFFDYGAWVKWTKKTKSTTVGLRLREYSNIYILSIDTGSFSNLYVSSLNTGTQYVAHSKATETYLSGNISNYNLIQSKPLELFYQSMNPRNFIILLDYIENINLNQKHGIEIGLIGIPLNTNISELFSRDISVNWRFSGINFSRPDSLLPAFEVNRNSDSLNLNPGLNSGNGIFRSPQELHLGWMYKPTNYLIYSIKYSYSSNHLFNNTNLSLSANQNHGKNLQLISRVNFSSQFGNWNEIGLIFKPIPNLTTYLNISGTNNIRFRDNIQVNPNLRVFSLTFGLISNLQNKI